MWMDPQFVIREGWYLRDFQKPLRIFCQAFQQSISLNSNAVAELWAVREGLGLLYILVIKNYIWILIPSFFFCFVQEGARPGRLRALIWDCLQLVQEFEFLKLSFCYWEANTVADV